MTDSNNYIVYEVRHNGVPIYIGSGKEGLKPGSRQHVHMITDLNKAREVGTRHGVPVVIEVDIQALIDDTSQLVYESSNGYILTEHVPPKYLKIYKGDKDVSI